MLSDSKASFSNLNFLFDEAVKNLQPFLYSLNSDLTFSATSVIFENVHSENEKLLVFDISFKSVNLNSCSFINCSNKDYIFSLEKVGLIISDTTIQCPKDANKKSKGAISYIASGTSTCSITNSNFVNLDAFAFSLSLATTIQYCTFDNSYFNIIHNIIQNNVNLNGCSCILESSSTITETLENITFLHNQCDSLYGGGAGFFIKSTSSVTFIYGKFISNKAIQNTENKRPYQYEEYPYYNGDGGAFQIGYSWDNKDMTNEFERCIFNDNEAYRHGGALAIQTLTTVDIIDCTFERNFVSNYLSPTLLYNDNFHQKIEGKNYFFFLKKNYIYDHYF